MENTYKRLGPQSPSLGSQKLGFFGHASVVSTLPIMRKGTLDRATLQGWVPKAGRLANDLTSMYLGFSTQRGCCESENLS